MMVAACSEPSATAPFARVFDACAPLALSAPAAGAGEHASVGEAAALWHDVGVTGPEQAAGEGVTLSFGHAAPGVYGFYDDVGATILVSDALADPARAVVIAHELGHAFGLVHVPVTERISVMNAGNLATVPTEDDRAAVAALWGDCAAR
jgi:hypothetical protein